MSEPRHEDDPLFVTTFNPSSTHAQTQSPLFSTLPPEIREHIFRFILLSAPNPDPNLAYDPQSCFVRPGYTAPHTSSTALLRTCRRIFSEAWSFPFTSAEHTLFFTAPDRKPANASDPAHLTTKLLALHRVGVSDRHLELDHIRIFPQLVSLEPGRSLQNTLDIAHFFPRVLTICLRHTDWWFWESDEPLRINAEWVRTCRFPDSLTCIRMELESLERKQNQIDDIAAQMRETWRFQRKDGTVMAVDPKEPFTTERWSGTSIWNGQRWQRDESGKVDENGEEIMELDYYVLTLRWRPIRDGKGNNMTGEPAVTPDLYARNPGPKRIGSALRWPPAKYIGRKCTKGMRRSPRFVEGDAQGGPSASGVGRTV